MVHQIRQEELSETPIEAPIKKTAPDIDFDNGNYDYAPLPKARFSIGNIMEWTFERMHPRKPVVQKSRKVSVLDPRILPVKPMPQGEPTLPEGYEISNGLLINKKSLAEKVRDQIKFPWIKSSSEIVRGIAAIVLCIGAFMIYAQIPGHPEIVIGVVLVSLAGNVIMAKW